MFKNRSIIKHYSLFGFNFDNFDLKIAFGFFIGFFILFFSIILISKIFT